MRDLYSAVRRAVQRGAGRDLLRRRRGADRRGLGSDRAGDGRGGQVKRFLISADWVGCSGLQGQDFCFSAYFHSFPLISADCCDSGVVVWHKRADGVRGGQVKRLLISEDWVGCSGLQGQDFYFSTYFRSFPPILAIRGWSSGPGRAGGGCGGQVKRFLTSADWVGFSGLQRQDFYCSAYFRSFPPIVAIRGWSSGPDRAGGGRGGQVKRFLISEDWVGCSGLQGQDFYFSAYFRSFPPILAIPGWSPCNKRTCGGGWRNGLSIRHRYHDRDRPRGLASGECQQKEAPTAGLYAETLNVRSM